jgi:thiol-disulfide isomerase/thioredoxin
MKRRALLAGGAAVAGASVAVALELRKPPVLHLAAADAGGADAGGPEGRGLDGLGNLVLADPVRAAPDIGFRDGQGQERRLASFAGRAMVLNFWATWCAPCVRELPALAALAPRAAAEGISVLALSQDGGGAAVVRAYFAAHRIADLPVWLDPEGAAGRAMGIRGVPTTFLINRRGRIVALLEGAADWSSDAALARIRGLTG